jgi:hypothetical protein
MAPHGSLLERGHGPAWLADAFMFATQRLWLRRLSMAHHWKKNPNGLRLCRGEFNLFLLAQDCRASRSIRGTQESSVMAAYLLPILDLELYGPVHLPGRIVFCAALPAQGRCVSQRHLETLLLSIVLGTSLGPVLIPWNLRLTSILRRPHSLHFTNTNNHNNLNFPPPHSRVNKFSKKSIFILTSKPQATQV